MFTRTKCLRKEDGACLSSLEPREKATHGQCRAEIVTEAAVRTAGNTPAHASEPKMALARISCWARRVPVDLLPSA